MKPKYLLIPVLLLNGFFAFVPPVFAQGTAFIYQGRLVDGGIPANGAYDLRLILFTMDVGGSQQGPILTNTAVAVDTGLFTTTLDFGPNIFTGSNYFLEIAVRTNGSGTFTTLSPRQPVTPVPYAITANSAGNLLNGLPAAQLTGPLPSANLSGTYSNPLSLANAANVLSGNGNGLTSLNASQLTAGTVPDTRLSANIALRTGGNTLTGSQILNSGNLGINTGSPVTKLQVNGSTVLQGPGLAPTASSASNILNLTVGGATSNGFLNGISFYEAAASPSLSLGYDGTVAGTANNALRIYDSTGAPIFSFLHSGNLGIGTTAPASALHVRDAADAEISIESADVGSHRWTLQSSRVTGTSATDATFQVIDRTVGSSRLTIATNGNVGIHTTAPATTFEVNGTATVKDLVVSNQVVHPYGTNSSPIQPIAYGSVGSIGDVRSGTGNFTVTADGSGTYTITIAGEDYFSDGYVTLVTPTLNPRVPITSFTVDGKLLVKLFSTSGSLDPGSFHFIVYKP